MTKQPWEKFDEKIKALDGSREMPRQLREAMIEVHDTLEVAKLAAASVFGTDAPPSVVMQINDLFWKRRAELLEERAAAEND